MSAIERKATFHTAAVATAAGDVLNTTQLASVLVQITGTFVATITFQTTIDGSNWVAIEALDLTTGARSSTATGPGLYLVPLPGAALFRCNMTWTSGTSITATGLGTSFPVILPTPAEGITIALTPTVTAGAYTAGEAVGGLLTFANAARTSGAGGLIKSLVLIDDAGQDAELELWLFDRTFTAIADNAAWTPSEADLENLIAVISTVDSAQGWLAAGTPSAIDIEISKRYDLAGTSLFGQLVTRGTPTLAATDDVTVKLGLLQD